MSELITAWATAAGTLFTAASVWFAIFVYRRERDKALFASLRTSLIDIHSNIKHLDQLLSEGGFTEIGTRIAEEVERCFDHESDAKDIVRSIEEDVDRALFKLPILMGLNASATVAQIEQICRNVERLPYVNAGQIPLIREILSGCIFYAVRTAKGVISSTLLDTALSSKTARKEFASRTKKSNNVRQVYEEIAILVVSACATVLKRKGQQVVDDIRRMLDIVTNRLSAMTDAELRRLRRQLRSVAIKDSKDSLMIEDVFARLNRMRDLFTDNEWDDIVGAKARIIASAHSNDSD